MPALSSLFLRRSGEPRAMPLLSFPVLEIYSRMPKQTRTLPAHVDSLFALGTRRSAYPPTQFHYPKCRVIVRSVSPSLKIPQGCFLTFIAPVGSSFFSTSR
ncbi:uncharacterized protein BJX67DRAFT_340109 [Aspergillus lucknowensis]|uniref:Uncharacterized protein n=1 Tax=Aspergillus lucknowensis TaxID=176173 RepID=A0ABR4M7U7_9EURO